MPIVKAPKIVQYSVGHEGTHCLLVTEDGSVFFVGAAKRGEDGDTGSLCESQYLVFNLFQVSTVNLQVFFMKFNFFELEYICFVKN